VWCIESLRGLHVSHLLFKSKQTFSKYIFIFKSVLTHRRHAFHNREARAAKAKIRAAPSATCAAKIKGSLKNKISCKHFNGQIPMFKTS
jgi:hypothetical protein